MSDSLTTIYIESHQCSLHQLTLLTQGPILDIMAKIAQPLVVVEKLSFLRQPFFFQKIKNASFLLKLVIVYGIPRMGRNFDDYPGFQQEITHAN